MNAVSKILRKRAKDAKAIFDLCNQNEGLHNKVHILENTEAFFDGKSFRVYISEGFCFDVTKEAVHLAEDETNDSAIDDYEYLFFSGWEGFQEVDEANAIRILKRNLRK